EKIHVTIDKDFKTAKYVIEYVVKTDTTGEQIPLLFYAIDYKNDFQVWVNNKKTDIKEIPSKYKTPIGTPFEQFSGYFISSFADYSQSDSTYFFEDGMKSFEMKDLKYFETKLQKGNHVIRVEYIANQWIDNSNWIKEYSFRYWLAPAKHWKSFGTLEITIDASSFKAPITTNLGQPTSGKLDSIAVWRFGKLPNDSFNIAYIPEFSWLSKLMITIGPLGITLILSLIIVWVHFLLIKNHRAKNRQKKFSWIVFIGSLINPFAILLCYILSFDLIDALIGIEAGRHHGYTFFAMLLYPIFLFIYMLIFRKVDSSYHKL
ncbi:MAG: hypothetical protein Q8909_08980, partial [Bacteroidota bacterium]|nr:hypothetical protein [Bacteroidota bacterium]